MWNKIFKRSNPYLENPNYSLNDGIRHAEYLVDGLIEGVRVTPDSVMSHPMIRGGVQIIGNLASTLPLNVMIDGGIAGRAVDYEHPWQRRLNHRPTGICPRSTFIQNLLKEAIVYGNSYHLILPDRLMWLDPREVKVKTNGSNVIYEFKINGEDRRVDQSQIIHIRNLGTDGGLTGQPLHEALRTALASALAKYDHIRRYFENGTFSSLVWTLPPQASTKEKAEQFESSANAKYSGLNKAFRNIFLGQGGSVQPLTVSNTTSQTKELMEFDSIVVAQILSLPADWLGANQNTSYAAQSINDIQGLRQINHWLIQIEQEFSDKLLSIDDIITGQRWIEFNRKAKVEMDSQTEQALIVGAVSSGLMSKEYGRRKLNLPINDIDGETYFHPSNLIMMVAGQPEEVVPDAEVAELPEADEQAPVAEDKPEDTEDKPETDERMQKLVAANIRRMVDRVAKSNKPAKEHKDIWLETFSMFPKSEAKLIQLGNLIDGATESRSMIAQNINVDQWAIDLMEDN